MIKTIFSKGLIKKPGMSDSYTTLTTLTLPTLLILILILLYYNAYFMLILILTLLYYISPNLLGNLLLYIITLSR